MARSKGTFEKRQREAAKRRKQIEKASKRLQAKQRKAETDLGILGGDADAAGTGPDSRGEESDL